MEDLQKKFPLGTKVVPHSKSIGDAFKHSSAWSKAKKRDQPFLYVNGYYNGILVLNDESKPGNGGDYYRESDITLYSEEPNYEIY